MRDRFDGQIAGVGTTSGLRAVVGSWAAGPWGAFADVMVERPDGERLLLAPSPQVADLVASTYRFDRVVLTPVAAAVGVGGAASERVARTVLPATSALVVANGLQGTYLHVRGVSQRPGGWREWRYNAEMGPPVFAPLLVTVVGGMGLLASVLRRERSL